MNDEVLIVLDYNTRTRPLDPNKTFFNKALNKVKVEIKSTCYIVPLW